MIRLVLGSVLATLLLATSPTISAGEIGVEVVFSKTEIAAIRAYYTDHGSVKVGKVKKKGQKALPPGIARNLQRGKPLPPGIAKQALPGDLLRLLPPAPKGYERLVVAGKILLVEVATQVIHDVLEDVILR